MDHKHMPDKPDNGWANALQATLHCLTGCAIGEVLGMILSTAFNLSNFTTILISIVLAFALGYTLTMRGVLKAKVKLGTAFKVSLAADTISIAVMELVDNTVVAAIPGALNAQLNDWLFWASLALSLFLALIAATPVNRLLIQRGLGHAVMHQYHHVA